MSYRKECVLLGWWNILQMSNISIWSNMWNSSEFSLLTFFLDDLSIGDSGVFGSPTITVLGSICVFKFITVFLMYLDVPTFGTCMLKTDELSFHIIWSDLHCLFWLIIVWSLLCQCSYSCQFMESICLENLLSHFHSKPFFFFNEMSLL
jgi:hypothetical protein